MSDPVFLLQTQDLTVQAGSRLLLQKINLKVPEKQIFGLIGPSGAGKSTLLRCLNRLHDLVSNITVSGDVLLKNKSLYAPDTDVNSIRERIGMLFQQPVIFPTSIRENVLFGAKRLRHLNASQQTGLVEATLKETGLWDETRDRLSQPATLLSVGQQQRLCLARTLAVSPEILLMDEPTSALDPRSTALIEELLLRLKSKLTILIVTHNLAQAARITDQLAFLCPKNGTGELLEVGTSDKLLKRPETEALASYLQHH